MTPPDSDLATDTVVSDTVVDVVDAITADDAPNDLTVDLLAAEIEAILFLSDGPMAPDELAEVTSGNAAEVDAACRQLADDYEARGAGLHIAFVAGGWRMTTSDRVSIATRDFVLDGRGGRLSRAALETLAVIAYKQPITRTGVAEIRGVSADAAVRSLLTQGLVEEVGRATTPGTPALYGTTDKTLEALGLASMSELPPLAEHLPEGSAPDEPAADQFSAVRERLRKTGVLATAPARDNAEMDELIGDLDAAAESAANRLAAVLATAEEDPEAAHETEQHDSEQTDSEEDIATDVRSAEQDPTNDTA